MPRLDREEYIEQAYFFRVYRERIEENLPAQEVLALVREEILATTKLPLAIDFLNGELQHRGKISQGMAQLAHYFTPFQTFLVEQAERDNSKFDLRIALLMLEREAEYQADDPRPAALFVYQFECLARNRLGYDYGLQAVAGDPMYDATWKDWINKVRRQLGTVEFADMIYYRSDSYLTDLRREQRNPELPAPNPILFGASEGRIAKASRGKDPLYMFAALQRQLDYPNVPQARPARTGPLFEPAVEMRFQRVEARLQILEQEQKGTLDLGKLTKSGALDPLDESI
jgi:hypothetical protein